MNGPTHLPSPVSPKVATSQKVSNAQSREGGVIVLPDTSQVICATARNEQHFQPDGPRPRAVAVTSVTIAEIRFAG